MSTLIISHYIYLTKEERYNAHNGETIETTGVSIPVWFNKGTTSEPARELFCKYKITNENINKAITPTQEGYVINLPQKVELDEIPEEIKEAVGKQLVSSKDLLDIEDGGKELLEFKQLNKIKYKKELFNLIHFVEIKPKEILLKTLS